LNELVGNPYETEKLLEEYLLLHYGSPQTVLPWAFGPREALEFPRRCVSELIAPLLEGSGLAEGGAGRALELGCAVGRACFELSALCSQVVGIDFSHSFIREARRLASERHASFSFPEEGELRGQARVQLPDRFQPERVIFEVGDATALRSDLGDFDIVLAANLLCRVPDPPALLRQLPSLVRPGGLLVLTSPYTWSEEYTPRRHWLGGFTRGGEAVRSLSSLRQALEGPFELLDTVDMPFMIREHARKFQWSVAQASRWRRRS
jgi:putative 4-mercaptohistidine N1-methyltranferase